jgi:hypothetical protein
MKTLFLIVVMVVSFFFCSAGFSQDGWVLWEDFSISGVGTNSIHKTSWSILGGFPSWQLCKENLSQALEKRGNTYMGATSTPMPEVRYSGTSVSMILKDEGGNIKGMWSNSFHCLPSNIDPREKK